MRYIYVRKEPEMAVFYHFFQLFCLKYNIFHINMKVDGAAS